MTSFYSNHLEAGDNELGEEAAHHAQVRRMVVGDTVVVTNGIGDRGIGTLVGLGKKSMVVSVGPLDSVPCPRRIHLYVPIADRDRMLWLAEKATELQVSSWTPVMYRRSKSVTPRGEGDAFDRKARARMVSALEQSGGAWLPDVRAAIDATDLPRPGAMVGYVLERRGLSLARSAGSHEEIALAVGPEGGFEDDEIGRLIDAGWNLASLGNTILRFETAALAAVAVARALSA